MSHNIKKEGSFVLFTTDEYSDYSVHNIGVVKKTCCLCPDCVQGALRFMGYEVSPGLFRINEEDRPVAFHHLRMSDLAEFFVKAGVIEMVEYSEFNDLYDFYRRIE